MLDSRKLGMLSALQRLGTVAAVARELHLTGPGVSMQLASLEREVGVALTRRQGRRIALTPAGRLLAQHADRIVDALSLAHREVAALRAGTAGTYHLAAFPSAARTFVARTWKALLDDPALDLTIRLTEREPQDALPELANGGCDLAVTHSYSNLAAVQDDALVSVRLLSEPVWLATRRDQPVVEADPADSPADSPAEPAAASPADSPADLAAFASHDWVLPHERWSCHEMTQRACGLAGFIPRAVAEASDFSVLLELVAIGAGVALVPQLAVAALPAGVCLRPLRSPLFRHAFAVTRRVAQPDPGIRRLVGLLQEFAVAVLAEHTVRASQGASWSGNRRGQHPDPVTHP